MTFAKEQTAMMRSTDRIRVSHAGALPRPTDLQRLFEAGPAAVDAFTAALPGAVAEVVDEQVTAGVDVVNDGEISKRGLFIRPGRPRPGPLLLVRGGQPAARARVHGVAGDQAAQLWR